MEARKYLVSWHISDGCDKGSTVVNAYDAEDAATQVEVQQAAAHGLYLGREGRADARVVIRRIEPSP